MDVDGDEKERKDAEKDNGVSDHGWAAGSHAAELHHLVMPRQLEE